MIAPPAKPGALQTDHAIAAPTLAPTLVAASAPTSAASRRAEAAPDLAKRQQVAALLGIEEDDEATLMARLIDEFLALKGIAQAE